MTDVIAVAQSIEELGVTGILAGLVVIQGFVIRELWKSNKECWKKNSA